MEPNRWQKIESIFGEAIALSPAVRENFLADACGDDLGLREEIKSMLDEDSNDEFMSEPTFGIGARLLVEKDDLLVEPIFGSYELLRLLGRGGMGAVYLARDTRLERLVAVKVLPVSVFENEEDIERFRQEARTASGISHPNVAHIYEFGTTENRWFLAMEYVEGKSLREVIGERSLDEPTILKIATQITDALAATHRRGIVHRDIKPENIIIAADGTVKIVDFGLAKPNILPVEEKGKSDLKISESPKLMFGTVAYMSPEQIRGVGFDTNADLWSLGVMLFEMLTGKRPFSADDSDKLAAMILNREAAIDDCPKRFRAIVGKLLQKNSADRYAGAEELSADLKSLDGSSEVGEVTLNFAGKIWGRKILVSVLLLTIFILFGASLRKFNGSTSPSPEQPKFDSIAVLPLVSANDNESEGSLADGFTESLINKLSRLSNLSVKSKNSVARYKGKPVEARRIGGELAVQVVLSGRVGEEGDFIRLDLDLTDAQTGERIWTKRYDRYKTELVVLQNEIEKDVFANLNLRPSVADERILGKNYTENPDAYRFYLKGRFHWNKRTAKDLVKAIEYYNQAIAVDQKFALAYAGLADAYLITSGYGIHQPVESFPKAKEMALKALAIDNTLAEAHNALSYELCNYEWNLPEAEKEIRLAIELNPNYATTHQWYASAILTATGRLDEAVAEAKKAQELDSVSLSVNTDLGAVLLFARRDDEAVEQLRRTLEMDENFGNARAYLCRAYLMQKNFSAAIAECRKSETLYNDPRPTAYLARVYAEQDEREKAMRIIERLKAADQHKYVSKYYFAIIYAGLGDKDRAFEYLEKAFQEREGRLLLLRSDPLMDRLSGDPRFDALINRIHPLN